MPVGVDKDSGTAHTLVMTTARMHNSACALLHSDEQEVSGDKGYDSHQLRTALERLTWCTARRIYGSFSAVEKKRRRRQNKKWGRVRAIVEHILRVVTCQFGYRKIRDKELAKNAAQLSALFALANLYLLRKALLS